MDTPNEYEYDIKLGEAITRLKKNKDFKLVINDLFLEGGAINLTKNINMVKDEEIVVNQIKARGYLYRFIMELEDNANGAREALLDMQQEEA